MAIFHLSIKIISRGDDGKSVIAAAAYRTAEKIKNERDGVIHDYTRKGGVVHTEILLPANAPPMYGDRSVLWNAVEKVEKHSRAQLAREIEFALPAELTRGQNISLARRYVKKNFVDAGMCADLCIHDKGDGKPHAHVLLTMRPFNDDGTWGDKQKKIYILDADGIKIYDKRRKTYKCDKAQTTDWNEQTKAEEWRKAWADIANSALKYYGVDKVIDHRSYERQGVDKIPTIKMGPAATQMERRGVQTDRGNINRSIEFTNGQIRALRARVNNVNKWLHSVPLDSIMPSMADMVCGINDGLKLQSRYEQVRDLKIMGELLVFCKRNNVYDMEGLANSVQSIHKRHYETAGELKKLNRRIGDLTRHLANYDSYKAHRAVYNKYISLDKKKRQAFYDRHADEIEKYESAKEYLDCVMNGKTQIPVKAWRKEVVDKMAKRYELYDTFYKLRDDVKNVERLRSRAEQIMSGYALDRTQQRSRDGR